MFLDYEYFCGANVVVDIGGLSVLECAGIQVSASDSKIPIYGYSSRHFDAVAAGQVLVRGTLLINYVHQDYLYRLMELSKGSGLANVVGRVSSGGEIPNFDAGDQIDAEIRASLFQDHLDEYGLAEALKTKYWASEPTEKIFDSMQVYNPFDMKASVDIKITFGERSPLDQYLGVTNMVLNDVFFTGRGTAIQISEDVVIEEYSFFARKITSILPKPDRVQIVENEIEFEGDV